MTEETYEYLKNKDFYQYGFEGSVIKYKFLNLTQQINLGLQNLKYAEIKSRDPMVKSNKKLCIGDVIAIYRDYELKVSPYYFMRKVVD